MPRQLLKAEGGQGLVEFVVAFPIFAIFVLGILHGGWVLLRMNAIESGTAEGARVAAVSGCFSSGSCNGVRTDVVQTVKNQSRGAMDSVPAAGNCNEYASAERAICVEWVPGPDGQGPGDIGSGIRVRVKYVYEFPLGGADFDLESCAVSRLERRVSNPPATSSQTACP